MHFDPSRLLAEERKMKVWHKIHGCWFREDEKDEARNEMK